LGGQGGLSRTQVSFDAVGNAVAEPATAVSRAAERFA